MAQATPPAQRFGAVESYQHPDDAADAGVGFERMIFEWRYFQPNSPDDWDTSSIPEEWLAAAQRQGRMVMGLIKNAPHWATGSDLLGAPPLNMDLPIDDPNNYWAAFVSKLIKYYGTKWDIHHWIIYNEPDIRPYNTQLFEFAGEVRDYYKVVKTAYKAAHATDPQVVIHLAGFTYWNDVVYNRNFYLDRFLRTAENDPEARANNLFFDVFTAHVFAGTDWVWYITRLFKGMVTKAGYDKPIWIDEMNVPVTDDPGYPVYQEISPISLDQQASFLIQGSALGLAAGAERIEVYKLYDDVENRQNYEAWGLVRVDGTRRPGFYALKTITEYFNDTTSATRYKNGYATLVTLTQSGRTVYVIWGQTYQPVFAQIQASDPNAPATLIGITGQSQRIRPTPKGTYQLYLPACLKPCFVQGQPWILIQDGEPQKAWVIKDEQSIPLNKSK